MRSVNSARERLNPVVLMLAMLLAMTSRFCSWALMPVAAIANALIKDSSLYAKTLDRHPCDLLIGGYRLVPDCQRLTQRALRAHDRFDDLERRQGALDSLDRRAFAGLQRADRVADDLTQGLGEARSRSRCRSRRRRR